MHPYELGRRRKQHGKDRNVKYNRGSLYMVVEQLRTAGFITQQQTVRDTQRPDRTIYRITDRGRDELDDWMRELVAQPREECAHFGSPCRCWPCSPQRRRPSYSAGVWRR
jgi:DNA-binding PadR family transcriptional regulator